MLVQGCCPQVYGKDHGELVLSGAFELFLVEASRQPCLLRSVKSRSHVVIAIWTYVCYKACVHFVACAIISRRIWLTAIVVLTWVDAVQI